MYSDIFIVALIEKTIARSARVSRWRLENIAETRMFSDVAGINTALKYNKEGTTLKTKNSLL